MGSEARPKGTRPDLVLFPIWSTVALEQRGRALTVEKSRGSIHFQAKAFRAINLTSFILKTLVKMVIRYLLENILSKQSSYRNQHAYI